MTMRKVAALLVVLLGAAHFVAVSRCEDGESFNQLTNPPTLNLLVTVRTS